MNSSFCTSCCLGKIHNLPFPSSENDCKTPLQIVHTDLWGPASTPSIYGYRYYIHFIDDYSKFTWIYMLRNKSEAFQTFCNFKSQVELQLGYKIRSLQPYWGGEYRAFTKFLQEHGIHHRLSCLGPHQQNGTAERKHGHIVETGLILLAQASMPLQYWDEAFRTSVYLIKRLPTITLQGISPLEALLGTPPQYSSLKVFGCSCFPNIRYSNQQKLQYRSIECTFLGYSLNHKGYKCLDPSGKIIIS